MSYRWAVIIGLVSVVNSAAMLVSLSVGIMLPDIKEDLAMGGMKAGGLGAISPFATILLSVPVAAIVSRFNARVMIFAGAVHMALFAVVMGWAPSYALLMTARFVFMVGLVARQANMAMLIPQWFEQDEIPRVQSVVQVVTSSVSIAAYALLPWFLVWLDGWRNTFYVLAALMAISAVAWLVLARDRQHPATAAAKSAEAETRGSTLAAIRRYPVIWYWGIGTAFCLVGVSSFTVFWPTFLTEERDLSLRVAGLFTAGIPLGNVVGALHASYVRNRVTRRRQQMYLTGVMCTSSMVVMAFAPFPWVLPIAAFGLGWACMQVFPTIMTLPYELPGIKPREVAVVSSFLFSVFTVGMVVGPLLTGILEQATGSLQTAFLVVPVVHLGIFIVAFASEKGLPPTPRVARERAAREPAIGHAVEEAAA